VGVEVQVVDALGTQFVATHATSDDGRFEVSGLGAGHYSVIGRRNGLLPASRTLEIENSDVPEFNLPMSAGFSVHGQTSPPVAAQITIAVPASLRDSRPLLFEAALSVRAETDEQGRFLLRNVPPGMFVLQAIATDGLMGTTPINLVDGDLTSVSVALYPSSSVSGRVVKSDGTPVAGIELFAVDSSEASQITSINKTAISTTDGTFFIGGLHAGKYDLLVVRNEEPPKRVTTIELASQELRKDIRVVVADRGGIIRGRVVDAQGAPVANALVRGARLSVDGVRRLELTRDISTDASGGFALQDLADGIYAVIATDAKGLSQGEKRLVKTGDDVLIELTPLSVVTITATVHGKPVAELDSAVCIGSLGQSVRTTVVAPGVIALGSLAPGEYDCTLESNVGIAHRKFSVASAALALEVELLPWATLRGTAIDVIQHRPVGGLSVIAGAANAVTDNQGRFLVANVRPGQHDYYFSAPGQGRFYGVDKREYIAEPGASIDLGTIEVLAPSTGRGGTLGFVAESGVGVLVVTSVANNGPAEKARLQPGDEIEAINGRPIAEIGTTLALRLVTPGNLDAGAVLRFSVHEREVTITAEPL
jgi:hypothetical protein